MLFLLLEMRYVGVCFFFFQAEDGIRDLYVTGVQTCALPIFLRAPARPAGDAMIRRAAIVLLAWGAWLGLFTAVQAPFHSHVIEYGMLGAASAATLLAGAVLWAIDARRPGPARRLAIPDSSVATATFVTGLALALVGAG